MEPISFDEQLDNPPPAEIVYKIADNRAEWLAAFELLHRSYLRAGLSTENPRGLRVTPYHLLSTTEVFVAQLRGQVISTLTVVREAGMPLPLEAIYGAEVERMRQSGLRLAEVSCLADRRQDPRRFFPVFLQLSRLMVQAARRRGIDRLLIVVHPRHARFYQRYMSFAPFAEERVYPAVNDHPALPLMLDFNEIDRVRPPHYELFFGEAIPEERTRQRLMSHDDRAYFAEIALAIQTRSPIDFVTDNAEIGVESTAHC